VLVAARVIGLDTFGDLVPGVELDLQDRVDGQAALVCVGGRSVGHALNERLGGDHLVMNSSSVIGPLMSFAIPAQQPQGVS
jgi:hypothetical protein